MSWDILLKKQPVDKRSLSATIQSDARTEKLLEQLKNQKPIDGFLGLLYLVKQGKLSAKDLYVINPRGTVTVEQAEANLQKLISFVKPAEPIEGQKLLDEGLKLIASRDEPTFSDQDKKRIAEIKTEVEKWYKSGKVKEGRSAKKAKLAASYRTFMRMAGNWVLKFNNIPEDEEKKRQFTENITEFAGTPVEEAKPREVTILIPLGTVVGDEIHTGFNNKREFILALRNNGNLKTAYNELVREYSPNLGGKSVGKDNPMQAELERRVAYGETLQAIDIQNIIQVNDYLEVVGTLEGMVTRWMPNDFTLTGDKVFKGKLPLNFFLTPASAEKRGRKGDGKSVSNLLLNPYANVLLASSFSGKNWFPKFFRSFRIKEGKKLAGAEEQVYSDIVNLINGRGSEYGFSAKDFEVKEDVLLTLSTDKNTQKAQIKRFLEKNPDVKKEVEGKITGKQDVYFDNLLQDSLTTKEKNRLEQGWKELSESLEGWEEAKPRKRARIVSQNLGDLEFEDKKGGFYQISYEGEKMSPEEFLQVITSPDSLLDSDEQNSVKTLIGKEEDIKEEVPPTTSRVQSLRRYGSKDTGFVFFLLSLSKEEITRIVTEKADGTATFMNKIDPLKSLKFFSKMSERISGAYANRVKEDLLAIAEEDDIEKKRAKAEKLDKDMPEILNVMRDAFFEAFSQKLKDFAENYVKYSPKKPEKTINAIDRFKEKGLLTGGN